MFGTSMLLAFAALLRNKTRSMLTMLGIVIGVAAVVLMQAMGTGATAYVGEAISGLGTNMLLVTPGAARGMQHDVGARMFTEGDLDAIRRQAHDVALVTPAGSRIALIVAGPYNRSVKVIGVQPEYFAIRSWGASIGRILTTEDERQAASVCLIGQTVADALYPGEDPLGRELRIQKIGCRVVGVMEAKGASSFGIDQDDVVLVPHSTFAQRLAGSDRIPLLTAAATSEDRIDAAKEQLTDILRRRRHITPGDDDDFTVQDPREVQALLQSVTGMLTTILAGIAALSLVVGGIGIMNIMLVSVTERTREIGIRLAIGARASDVLTQFLIEATVLSAVGGAVGVAIGLVGAMAVARGVHIPFVVPTSAVPIAFGTSVLVGVSFGVFPARKAARLSPLAALRHE